MKNEVFSIMNLDKYAEYIREAAAKSFSETYTENLDDFISINQVIEVIKQNSLGTDDNNCLMINEKIFDIVFDEIREMLYGVSLAKLASKGHVECAWDDTSNQMVFWLPNKDNTNVSSKPS